MFTIYKVYVLSPELEADSLCVMVIGISDLEPFGLDVQSVPECSLSCHSVFLPAFSPMLDVKQKPWWMMGSVSASVSQTTFLTTCL